MKRIVLILLAILVLTGCNDVGKVPSDNISSDFNLLSSDFSQSDVKEITKYEGKREYNSVSLGYACRLDYQNNYYYSDEFGFFCVNKSSEKKTSFLEEGLYTMKCYKQQIYFVETPNVIVFDAQTHKITEKSFNELFPLDIQVPQIRYDIDVIMVEDGWLVYIRDNSYDTTEVYLTDSNFTTKKLLPIERFDIVLDDEVFYFDKDGNVLCYNISLDKHSYVTKFTDALSENQTSNTITYLGDGKLLVCRNNKIHIIDLVDCTSFLEIPYDAGSLENCSPYALYDDDKMYLLIWEAEESYRVDAISRKDKKVETICKNTFDLPIVHCELASQDQQHLYLYNTGYDNDDGTPSSGFWKIEKNFN